MAAIYRDSIFASKPIPRMIGKFSLEQQDPNAPAKEEMQES